MWRESNDTFSARYVLYSRLEKFYKNLRVIISLKNIAPRHEAKRRKLNRVREKRKRWELIWDEAQHSDASSAHAISACFSLSDRCSERVPSAMECQLKRDKTNRRTRELSTDKAVRRLRYGLCTRFDRGPVWHTVWIHRRQNFILDTYRIQFLPIARYNVISRANGRNFLSDSRTPSLIIFAHNFTRGICVHEFLIYQDFRKILHYNNPKPRVYFEFILLLQPT